jgi:hypothetical protein
MAFCTECGGEFTEGTKFCSGCGANLDGTTEVTTPHCSQCGVELVEGVKFCNACGFKTDDVAAAAVAVAPVTNTVGRVNCPHCQGIGTVIVEKVKKKKGVSPGKVAGALFTGGISLVGTGLAKKEVVNQLTCTACGISWEI